MDEYEYLEAALDKPAAAEQHSPNGNGAPAQEPSPAAETVPVEASDRKKRRSRSRSRDKKKRSRSRSRDRRSKREDRSRSRERKDRDRRRDDEDRERRDRERRDHDRRDDYRDRRDEYRDRGRRDDRRDDYGRRRERTPPEARAAREAEKELREMERSTRTAFAYNLSLKAGEREIYQFFSKVGKVVDIKLITDKTTKRSKGFAYIEFSKVDEVIAAVALTGQLFMGQAVMVKSSEHEKNLAWEAQQQAKQGQLKATALLGAAPAAPMAAAALAGGPCKLHVANLNPAISESDVQALFAPFGNIDSVQLVRDAAGRSQGSGFVQYSSGADAAKAMEHWNGREVAGSALTVTVAPALAIPPVVAAPPPPLVSAVTQASLLAAAPQLALLPQFAGLAASLPAAPLPGPPPLPGGLSLPGVSLPGLALPTSLPGAPAPLPGLTLPAGITLPPGMTLPGSAPLPGPPPLPEAAPAPAPEPMPNSGIGELDEEETRGGLKLTSDRRQALMAKLASSAGLAPMTFNIPGITQPAAAPAGPKVDAAVTMIQSVLGPASPIPTPCLLIKNMFDPQEAAREMGEGWADEISADVRDECGKYGAVAHIHVDAASQGCVYLKFSTTESATAAQHAMHGRWFAGRQLAVDFQFLQPYNSHFKL